MKHNVTITEDLIMANPLSKGVAGSRDLLARKKQNGPQEAECY